MKILLTILSCALTCVFYSQTMQRKPLLDEKYKVGAALKSPEYNITCQGEIKPNSIDLKWKPILVNRCVTKTHSSPDKDLIKLKEEKTKLKLEQNVGKGSSQAEQGQGVIPTMGSNFDGNANNGGSPLDNSIAISNGGWIVSVANTSIEYYNTSGNNSFSNDIVSFLNDNIVTSVCDPVVIYDTGADRFIFFVQECSGHSDDSFIFILFSKTNNPNDGWWKYKFTGNPMNNNTWFDYPKLAVSTVGSPGTELEFAL